MSYQRLNHKLQWFDAESTEYVYGCGDNKIEDYNSYYEHLPSLVELVGRIILVETKDFGYATKIVVALAHHLKIEHKLRRDKYPYEEMEMQLGHDYRMEMEYWMTYFSDTAAARAIAHFPDDDIADFNYLLNFSEKELYEMKS
jgi:hypothetical protein